MCWLALWDIIKICGVEGKLVNAIKSFIGDASRCVKISWETSGNFEITVALRQDTARPHGCPVFTGSAGREMKGKVREDGAKCVPGEGCG